jgi:N2-acetyl-L-2,4-diaminobutanoate deacetylase
MTTLDVVRVGHGPPELWLIAGVHGDEVEGIFVVEEALKTIRPSRGSLVGVSVAHPAALALGTREGPDGVDLNRTYPGRAQGGPTERVAFDLWHSLTAAAPAAVVTFHSWSRTGSATPYVEHAAGHARSRDLALVLGLPFVEAWDWPLGLLGRGTTALDIPSAELELFGLGRHTDEGFAYGIRAARAAAAWLGMIDPVDFGPAIEVGRQVLIAPRDGRVVQLAELGSEVTAGQPVAELRGSDGKTTDVLSAGNAGWVGIHVTYGRVKVSDPVAVIFVPLGRPGSIDGPPL